MTGIGSADGAGDGDMPRSEAVAELECVIGLEIHIQLSTNTKMFCGCPVGFGEEPNTLVCPLCLGHPGTLPTINERAVEYATRVGLALNCEIAPYTIFHRKNYFYPDLPKGYQISQYDLPLAVGGYLDVESPSGGTHRVGITRCHLEDDAGKLVHAGGTAGRIEGADHSLVDFNRGGTPLVEIVSEPDIRSPEQARLFLTQLRSLIRQLGVSDVNMEEGSLRVDANISLRRPGEPLGTKTELKNMNSFRYLQRALEAELERQMVLLASGERIVQETVHFDPGTGSISALRSKEEAHDYRYFPEPDLVPIVLSPEYVQQVLATLPELPAARKERFVEQYGLPAYDAGVLSVQGELADYFEQVSVSVGDPKMAANWVTGELAAYLNSTGYDVADSEVSAAGLSELLRLLKDGTLSSKMAKDVFHAMTETGKSAGAIVEEKGLGQISDTGELEAIVRGLIEANPGPAEEFRQGREKVLGFFVGQIMKQTRGQANPQIVNDLLRKHLVK
jgi:aspartyl-tRNA(Asn)/glutamyl-tRNA(Gln) amidotransferase subunit B